MNVLEFLHQAIRVYHTRTNIPLDEIFRTLVQHIQSGCVPFKDHETVCVLCLQSGAAVKSTQKQGTIIVRYHRCLRCGTTFKSLESIKIIEEQKKTEKPCIFKKKGKKR